MNKSELIKEIENNIIKIGYSNDNVSLNEDGKFLKRMYEKNLTLSSDIYKKNIDPQEKENLIKIYKNRLKEEKEKINFDINKVKYLISTMSLTPVNDEILDELLIEKTLRIFENIKTIFLFFTKDAKNNFNKIKEKLSNQGINVIGEEVEDSIEMIRAYLRNTLRNKENSIDKDEIIIDITLGLKISAISVYKLAVEYGIKILNWKELFFPKYEKINDSEYNKLERQERTVFSIKLEILKEALEESRQILIDINEALDKEEYFILSNYYEKLAKIFNLETFLALDPNNFFRKAKIFLNDILSYGNFNERVREKIKDFIFLLKIISDTDDERYFEKNS